MQKIVINVCFGGFGLSQSAIDWFNEKHGIIVDQYDLERTDPKLVECVEFLGSAVASDGCAKLKVVEVPDGVEWQIEEYDGMEHVAEVHRTWGADL